MPNQSFLDARPETFLLSPALSHDVQELDRLLGEVLAEQNDASLVPLARRMLSGDAPDPRTLFDELPELKDPVKVRQLARAFTVLFQVINSAEQKEIVRVNRQREHRRESIDDAVMHLKERGLSAESVQELVNRIEIAPTITAHPTEAKRRAVLDKLQTITVLLAEEESLPSLRQRLDAEGSAHEEIGRILTTLWQTDEMRAQRLTVPEEVRNAIYFFDRTILDVVPWLHEDLEHALVKHYPEHTFTVPTFLTYRSWVGGDRDGNPNVTADVTWNALLEHRVTILTNHLAKAIDLRIELTQSIKLVAASEELVESLEEDKKWLPFLPSQVRRYSQEPYVQKMLGVERRLKDTLDDALARQEGRPSNYEFAYKSPDELLADLKIVQRSLALDQARSVAYTGRLPHFIRQVEAFGFHLATLDIRQHSEEHEKALEEILLAAGVSSDGRLYRDLSEDEKVDLLTGELANPRPLLPLGYKVSDSTHQILEVFHVVRRALKELSGRSIVAYIISMTHGVSDLLEVLLFCKEAGLLRVAKDGQIECDIDAVPLFETIHDLHISADLTRAMFSNPAYRRYLEARGGFQEIMLGYSDSSKDGGYLAANWALQSTIESLAKVSEETHVPIRFFHGRGGTVGRGGGRANRAILSQPAGSFNGRIRFTEQGEVVSFRYSLPPIAHRHLEQIVSAVLLATDWAGAKSNQSFGAEERFGEAMTALEDVSRAAYRKLVYEDPDFWAFYTQATPIEHISLLPIASRPVSRSSNAIHGVENLRAIPWNFAWVQSRHVLVGWYGIGTALAEFLNRPDGLDTLRRMYKEWPFFQTVVDNAQLELIRAHIPTSRMYAECVEPPEIGVRIQNIIEEEHHRTISALLRITGQTSLLESARVVRSTVEFRNPMVTPLSALQVALMHAWPKLSEDERAGNWREAMLQTIAGIAAAMQSTG